jgi:hypothetical protein
LSCRAVATSGPGYANPPRSVSLIYGWDEEMTLDHAIATLYAREINCGCETFWDGGMKVWIGDIMNGHHSETMFRRENMGNAGQWLVDEAARLFPKAFQ